MRGTKAIRDAVRDVLYYDTEIFKLCLKLLAEDIGYDFYGRVRADVVSQIRSHSKVLDGIDDTTILISLRNVYKGVLIAKNLINPEDLDPELTKLESTILERFGVKEEE